MMMGWRFAIAVAILAWGILLLPEIGVGAFADAWIDGTPYLYEEARSLAQVLGHDDGSALAPALGVTNSAAYEPGDERSFYAINMRNNSQYMVKASARAISDRAYVFVENGRPVAPGEAESLLTSFDGIYDAITEQFGPPPDSIDRDPRVHILIMDILDNLQPNGTRLLGYFNPIDQYRNAQLARWTDRRSNEVEMLYVDYTSLGLQPGGAESVVAHEFTHMVQWARDPEEAVWVNEGIAVYTESLLGYKVDSRISAFEEKPDTSLLNWSSTIEDYGAAYLFFAYVAERFGGTVAINAILRNRGESTRGIESALAAQGKSISFDRLFSDWVIANYLDNPDINDGIYGYTTLDIHLKPSAVETIYPIAQRTSRVKAWSARYTEFKKEQEDTLSLTIYKDNGNDIFAQIIEMGDGINVSSVKSGNAQSGTAIIPQENDKTILVVTSQPAPPDLRTAYSKYTYSAEIQATATSVVPTPDRKATTWGSIKRGL